MEKFKGPQLTIVLYSFLFLFIFALSFFYLATTFPVPSIGNHTLGPGFYPSLISAALIVLITTQVVFDLKQNKLFNQEIISVAPRMDVLHSGRIRRCHVPDWLSGSHHPLLCAHSLYVRGQKLALVSGCPDIFLWPERCVC
ncbi:hypothetical protein [Endozoicomonas sp.]|uniref:hypothetical protein n=1 Tax=Endozoicomonas sp. TaxID=1892382 RepID=UPI003AF67436